MNLYLYRHLYLYLFLRHTCEPTDKVLCQNGIHHIHRSRSNKNRIVWRQHAAELCLREPKKKCVLKLIRRKGQKKIRFRVWLSFVCYFIWWTLRSCGQTICLAHEPSRPVNQSNWINSVVFRSHFPFSLRMRTTATAHHMLCRHTWSSSNVEPSA